MAEEAVVNFIHLYLWKAVESGLVSFSVGWLAMDGLLFPTVWLMLSFSFLFFFSASLRYLLLVGRVHVRCRGLYYSSLILLSSPFKITDQIRCFMVAFIQLLRGLVD